MNTRYADLMLLFQKAGSSPPLPQAAGKSNHLNQHFGRLGHKTTFNQEYRQCNGYVNPDFILLHHNNCTMGCFCHLRLLSGKGKLHNRICQQAQK